MFLAQDVVKQAAPVTDPLEELEVELVKSGEFLERVFKGEVGSLSTVAAVHLAAGKQF